MLGVGLGASPESVGSVGVVAIRVNVRGLGPRLARARFCRRMYLHQQPVTVKASASPSVSVSVSVSVNVKRE